MPFLATRWNHNLLDGDNKSQARNKPDASSTGCFSSKLSRKVYWSTNLLFTLLYFIHVRRKTDELLPGVYSFCLSLCHRRSRLHSIPARPSNGQITQSNRSMNRICASPLNCINGGYFPRMWWWKSVTWIFHKLVSYSQFVYIHTEWTWGEGTQ